ncbi:hypothetical protein D3C85_1685880 [compost metagenome]
MHLQVRLGGPDLIEDEQRWILLVPQHVIFDAAGLGTAWLDVGAEQRFEGFGFFRTGLGVQDETVQFAHRGGS